MIEVFTQCDPVYVKCVADGLKDATDDTQKCPIRTSHSHDAVIMAEEESMEAKAF